MKLQKCTVSKWVTHGEKGPHTSVCTSVQSSDDIKFCCLIRALGLSLKYNVSVCLTMPNFSLRTVCLLKDFCGIPKFNHIVFFFLFSPYKIFVVIVLPADAVLKFHVI